MYTYRLYGDTYVLSIDNRQSIVEALAAFCREAGVRCGEITGLGAVDSATLRFFDMSLGHYIDRTYDEQMEIANLTGNVSEKDGQVYLHLHITLGRKDYSALAGHLLDARICGACELFVRPLPGVVGRRFSPEIGINLYEF